MRPILTTTSARPAQAGDGIGLRFLELLHDRHQRRLDAVEEWLGIDSDQDDQNHQGGQAGDLVPANGPNPDVVVVDISMPVLNGIEAARKLKATGSRAKIVFLTVHADRDYVRAALGAGAVGYVLKSELASDLLPVVQRVAAEP